MREMLEAGVHFGHQTRRWNPKMKRYIFGKRNGIYIIDLQKTAELLDEALKYIEAMGAAGQKLLFVGTKRQAQDVVAQEAVRCSQFYVTHRWLGGMLTNFVTIRNSIDRLEEIEERLADVDSPLTKKEKIRLDREHTKINRNLVGIRKMGDLPDALFVVDPKREHIAIAEANSLGIPVVAIVDTNCDPEEVDFVIPGNDDAIRTIRLFTAAAAGAYLAGSQALQQALEQAEKDAAKAEEEAAAAAAPEPTDEAEAAATAETGEGELEKAAAEAGVEPETVEPVEPDTAETVEPETVEAVEPETAERVEPETVEPVEAEAIEEKPTEAEEVEPAQAQAETRPEPEVERSVEPDAETGAGEAEEDVPN